MFNEVLVEESTGAFENTVNLSCMKKQRESKGDIARRTRTTETTHSSYNATKQERMTHNGLSLLGTTTNFVPK